MEDEEDETNNEYEYENFEYFDPTNAVKEPQGQSYSKEIQGTGRQLQLSYSEYGSQDIQYLSQSNSLNPKPKKYGCNSNNKALNLIRRLNGKTRSEDFLEKLLNSERILTRKLSTKVTSDIKKCEEKKMSTIDMIRAIKALGSKRVLNKLQGQGSLNKYESDNGIRILSKISNYARNLQNNNY